MKKKKNNTEEEIVETVQEEPAPEELLKLSQASKTVANLTGKKSKTTLFGYLFLLLTIIILAVIAVTEFSGETNYPLSAVLSVWGENWKFLVLAIAVGVLAMLMDGFRQAALLRGATGKWRIKLTLKSTLLGKYFDGITPSAAGGQPYQVYYLHKNKVPAGVATSLPLLCFFMQQFAFFFIVIFSLIIHGPIVEDVLLQIAIYFGTLCMIFVPVAIMVFAFIPKTSRKIVSFFIKLLGKIRIVKNAEATTLKFYAYLDDYRKSLKIIGKHKKTLISGLLLAVICMLLNYSTVYFIVRASGQTLEWSTVIALMAYTSAASAFIPTPGSSGVSEGFFYLIVSVLTGGFRFWGMLLWRLLTFYMPVLTGLGVFINNAVKDKSYRRRGLIRTSDDDDDKGLEAKTKPTTTEYKDLSEEEKESIE